MLTDNFEFKTKCVIGVMDVSNAGAKTILGHARPSTEFASIPFADLALESCCKSPAVTLFSDEDATYIAITAKLSEDTRAATHLAHRLAQLLSAKGVNQVVVCAAILISFSTKNYFRIQLPTLRDERTQSQQQQCVCLSSSSDNSTTAISTATTTKTNASTNASPESTPKCTCISEFVLNDHLLSSLTHFLKLENIAVTMVLTRGNRPSKNSANEEVKLLAKYLAKEIPTFAFSAEKLKELKFRTTTSAKEFQPMYI